jgi:small subunit ribosomal protein S8e
MTKLGPKRIHPVRVRGGNTKHRALRVDSGNFAWGSEATTHKCRIVDVVYNASNNELVRTKTLVKGAVIQVDAHPFKMWWETHYGAALGKKKTGKNAAEVVEEKKQSSSVKAKHEERKDLAKVDPLLEEQFTTGRLYALVSSRPGQSGRCDGYILEGRELEFYLKKIKSKK